MIVPEIIFLTDRTPKAELEKNYPSLFDYLSKLGAITPNIELVQYCGLVILQDGPTFIFLPRNSLDPDTNNWQQKLDAAKGTMAALSRFARDSDRLALGKAEGSGGTIAPIIDELARDFRDHGVYEERLRVRSQNMGKPDWKRTIVREWPHQTSQGIVYTNFLSTKPVSSQDNILALIQTVVMSEIYKNHSWWLSGSFGSRRPTSEPPFVRYPRKQWIQLLMHFMRGLYLDRPLRLANLLCEYLKAESENPEGSFFCGLKDFHTVWERMLRDVLENVELGWAARLPVPNYVALDGTFEQSAGMIPDIVIRRADGLLVVDAKYYAASSVNNSPKLGDILKQISYLYAVRSVEPCLDVKTCFVFPCEANAIGHYNRVIFTDCNDTVSGVFPEIGCHYFPSLQIIDAYKSGSHISFDKLMAVS